MLSLSAIATTKAQSPESARRILIVEDDEDVLNSLADLIEIETSNRVRGAASIPDACDAAREFRPDVALLDVQLGQDRGLDLIEPLREIVPDMACVMMTAYRDPEYLQEALRLRADDFLYKPFQPFELTHVIEQQLLRQRLARNNAELNARYGRLIDLMSDWVWETDEKLRFTNFSGAEELAPGLDPSKIIGKHPWEVPYINSPDPAYAAEFYKMIAHEPFNGLNVKINLDDDVVRYWRMSGEPTFHRNGQFSGYFGVVVDTTNETVLREKLAYLADHDELTGLTNRRVLNDRIETSIARNSRLQQSFSVIAIDLDGFKPINDQFGHDAGDKMLTAIGDRLTKTLRSMDTVARVGGDEFLVLLPDIGDVDNARSVAEKILSLIQQPITYDAHEIGVSASLGVAIFDENCPGANELLARADRAMYTAKNSGGHSVSVYASEG